MIRISFLNKIDRRFFGPSYLSINRAYEYDSILFWWVHLILIDPSYSHGFIWFSWVHLIQTEKNYILPGFSPITVRSIVISNMDTVQLLYAIWCRNSGRLDITDNLVRYFMSLTELSRRTKVLPFTVSRQLWKYSPSLARHSPGFNNREMATTIWKVVNMNKFSPCMERNTLQHNIIFSLKCEANWLHTSIQWRNE